MSEPSSSVARTGAFDAMRLLFATLVLLSHAAELTDGNFSRELLSRFTHSGVSFGLFGVEGFFLLSGFLIAGSWERGPHLWPFLRRRILRIVPGYLVAALLSTLAVGLLAPAAPHFFTHLRGQFLASLLLLGSPVTPPVLPGQPYALVNGALWTIAYEFRCYLFVAVVGLLAPPRKRLWWLGASVVLIVLHIARPFQQLLVHHPLPPALQPLFGYPQSDVRLFMVFLVGGCFFFFRQEIVFRPRYALLAALFILAVEFFHTRQLELALVLGGSYLLFYLGQRSSSWLRLPAHLPDISYGVYLYGWPIEVLLIWFLHPSPWIVFLLATPACLLGGWLSWTFVELPFMRLQRRPPASVPAL